MDTENSQVCILLVDQLTDNGTLLNLALCANKPQCVYSIKQVATIEEARNLLSKEKFQLIMLNDSIELNASIRSLLDSFQAQPNVPIIIIGNETDEQKALEAISFGAQDYLIKSQLWDSAYVKRIVRHAIVRQQLKSQMEVTRERHKQMAYYDPLTQLPNRQLFYDRISQTVNQAKRNQSQFALLFIDLDNFKTVNDRHGHSAGDEVLRIVAQRLSKGIRASDTVARLGGDEFTVILNQVKDPNQAANIVRTLLRSVQEPIYYGQYELKIGASIGVSLYPNDASSIEELISYADQAMYASKEKQKNSYQIFHPQLAARYEIKQNLFASLQNAIPKQQLKLYYMPRVKVPENRITALEGLCHWNHPKLGLLKSTEFLPMADEEDLIFSIDKWALHRAFQDIKYMMNHDNFEVTISVNISVKSFMQLDLSSIILGFTSAPEILSRLEIEIPERILLEDYVEVSRKLEQLRQHNITLTLDNFGSGLTNLNALKMLNFDFVKIDKKFIELPEGSRTKSSHPITSAMIDLIRAFDLTPIVTGIEQASQLELGKRAKAEFAEGFLFSKPQQINSINQSLNKNISALSA